MNRTYDASDFAMASNEKTIRKNFEAHVVKDCKHDQSKTGKDCKNDQLKTLTYLKDQDFSSGVVKKLILQRFNGKKHDAIQYALNNRNYKLFIALLTKVDVHGYFEQHGDLLKLAIEAKNDKDKRLAAVLTAYFKFKIHLDLRKLPERTYKKLYEESWSGDIIKLLYDNTATFFIPRGQDKAKMQAAIYYNQTFTKSKDWYRKEAQAESDSIREGLRDEGFTVPSPIDDWTRQEMLKHLRAHVKEIGKNTSVLVICIMTHGELGVLFDKQSEKMEINEILQTARAELPQHIPLVLLIQSCQGDKEPNQSVNIHVDGGGMEDAAVAGTSATGPVCPPIAPIIVRWPETFVVTATPPGYYAYRDYFFPHMADQLRLSDGTKSFTSLVEGCSHAMRMTSTPSYSAQAPYYQSCLRKTLILPKSTVYDELTKVGKPGKYTCMHFFLVHVIWMCEMDIFTALY